MSIKTSIVKYIVKKWILDKPYALSLDEWDAWNIKTNNKFPVRYWLQETVTFWWSVNVSMRISSAYWYLTHRFNPKHKYNIIKPRTLAPGYYDSDTRILHAIMEEVTSFYENGCNYSAWRESSDHHAHAYNELDRVYWWWKDLWPHKETKSIWGDTIPEWSSSNTTTERLRISRIHWQNEIEWGDMEQEMMKRIIDIHQFMWY